MKFSCDRCQTSYSIADEKVGPAGVKARCKKCSHVIHVRREEPAGEAAALPETPPDGASLEDELGAAFESMLQDGPAGEEPSGPSKAVPSPDAAASPMGKAPGAGDDPESYEWFVAIEGQQVGPVRFADIQERWDRSVIGPDSLCWRSGLPDWEEISKIPDLASRLAPRGQGAAKVAEKVAEKAPSAKNAEASVSPKGPDTGNEASGFKPSAASALASLVNAEIQEAETRQEEAARNPAASVPDPETTGIRVLLKDLPEAPPAEPSKFIPIPKQSKAKPKVEVAKVKPAPAPVPRGQMQVATASREKSGGGKGLWAALVVFVLLAGGGAAAYFGGFLPSGGSPGDTSPAVVEIPRAPVTQLKEEAVAKDTVPAEDATEVAVAAGGMGGEGGSAEEALAAASAGKEEGEPAKEEEPAQEEAPAAPPKTQATAAPRPKGKSVAKAQRAPAPRATTSAPKAAPPPASSPTPSSAPAPARRSGDLLAAGTTNSIDALFEQELSAPTPVKSGGTGSYIPPPPGAGPKKPRSLAQGDIMGVVAAQKADLRGCANQYKQQGGTSGSVAMSWVIEPNGRTSAIKSVKGQEHAPMVSCLTGLIKGWRFPEYDGPRMAPIEFPFQF